MKLHVVKDLPSAQKAIEEIVLEGEGSPGVREGSHYDRFVKIRQAVREERRKDPAFDPARPVVLNPQTRRHRDAGEGATFITHEVTREVAELFNDIYSSMLLMLIQYYGYGGESAPQRAMLRDSCRRMMSAVVRPLAEVLTEMPATDDPGGGMRDPASRSTRGCAWHRTGPTAGRSSRRGSTRKSTTHLPSHGTPTTSRLWRGSGALRRRCGGLCSTSPRSLRGGRDAAAQIRRLVPVSPRD
jgi:hypothetical protein